MASEHPPTVNGFLSLLGGMHGGIAPDLLSDQQYAKGVNTSVREGLIRTRPSFRQVFSISEYDSQVFRGATTYKLSDGDYIVFGFGVTLFQFNVETGVVTNHGDRIDPNANRLFFCQAGKYLVIQDDVVGATFEDKQWPIILDGTTVYSDDPAVVAQRESDPFEALPKGQMMAYGHGRIFVAVDWLYSVTVDESVDPVVVTLGSDFVSTPRTSFIACDIYKSWAPSSVLSCIENTESGGGALSSPAEMGLITAMGFQRNAPTGTGHGPLVVFCERGAMTFAVNVPRETGAGSDIPDWANAGIGKILFQTTGLKADLSITSVNNDLVFLANDGIRTLRYTVAEAQSSGLDLSVDSISEEVKEWLTADGPDQKYASAAFANNRLMVTVGPTIEGEEFNWNGLISMDTSSTGGLTGNSSPVYDGVWTGMSFYQVLSARRAGRERLFIMGRGQAVESGIWELQDRLPDKEFNGVEKRIPCRVETKMFHFGEAFALKQLEFIDVCLRDVKGVVDVTAYYRTDGTKLWKKMGGFTVTELNDYGRTHWIRIPISNEECDPSGAPLMLHHGLAFQFAIEWTGIATIAPAKFMLKKIPRDEFLMCEPLTLTTQGSDTLFQLGDYDYKI